MKFIHLFEYLLFFLMEYPNKIAKLESTIPVKVAANLKLAETIILIK